MVQVLPFANALALLVAAVHALGAFFALAAPGLYLTLLETWFPVDLSPLAAGGVGLTFAGFLFGLLTATAAGWLIGLALAALYNALAAAREARA
jgi:hypothetical protein